MFKGKLKNIASKQNDSSMKRYLTGIQSSGRQHLGNILGAIGPAVAFSKRPDVECFYFIADLHSLTTKKDAEERKSNVYDTAAAWLAMGLDPEETVFYRQSDLPEVCELTWYLNCFTPYPMLANAHSFKDKSDNLSDVNAGLFTYPVLMAADILLYQAELVPVGKDQLQHLEITRDIAGGINHQFEKDIFTLPEAVTNEKIMTIPGTDGRKMSKSYGNVIDIFLPKNKLKKQVMGIETDSTPLEEPKDPESCTVFQLYSLLAGEDAKEEMRANYRAGGYGYGHAKKALLQLILENYAEERERFARIRENTGEIEAILAQGKERARKIGAETLDSIRQILGYE